MSDLKDKLEKEIETLNREFVVLLDVHAENYFETLMEFAALMSKRGKGVYFTASMPYRFISHEMQRRNINTDNILFLDCISAIAGEYEVNELCIFVENPSALEEISMYISVLLDKTKSDEKFLIMDSFSTLLIYNSINSVREFSMALINKLRLAGADGLLVIIEMDIPDDLKQILIAMCDKTIYV